MLGLIFNYFKNCISFHIIASHTYPKRQREWGRARQVGEEVEMSVCVVNLRGGGQAWHAKRRRKMEARRLQIATGQVKEGQGLRLLIAASCKKYFDVTVIFALYKYVRGGGMFVNSYTFIFSSACQQQFLSFLRERARGSRGRGIGR